MINIDELKTQIATLQGEIDRIAQMRDFLSRQLSKSESLNWIEVNGVTLDQVERCSSEDKPRFFTVFAFVEWMKKHGCKKPYYEWNGRIYETDSLLCDRMAGGVACMDDLYACDAKVVQS